MPVGNRRGVPPSERRCLEEHRADLGSGLIASHPGRQAHQPIVRLDSRAEPAAQRPLPAGRVDQVASLDHPPAAQFDAPASIFQADGLELAIGLEGRAALVHAAAQVGVEAIAVNVPQRPLRLEQSVLRTRLATPRALPLITGNVPCPHKRLPAAKLAERPPDRARERHAAPPRPRGCPVEDENGAAVVNEPRCSGEARRPRAYHAPYIELAVYGHPTPLVLLGPNSAAETAPCRCAAHLYSAAAGPWRPGRIRA